ncbi:NfeD family protein [Sulfurospirillum barnesii]|uniref:Membrane protein implicated in regulation of membrane protease activity n=1 Tax=Sulfurospirillum barnesii (strain ATCC 700032 / DSM 10660 / SES-3) TaxID=760154 RepID=I3XV51_SULBS|nr:NfeD family protein [Sulfurospirillum barnesii]AFL67825.1 membrane protein implicated in regulation of membrane protease activity [Sulfurospirillum barnesii SES-3]
MIWYIWAILGVFAIVFEIASPTFFATFLGLGFFGSALLSYFIEDSLVLQIIVALLGMFVGAIVFKKRRIADVPSSKIGQSDEFIGVKGKVIETISPEKNGRVQLVVPVLGSSQWDAKTVTDVTLDIGTSIEIIAIHGHYLDIKPI